MSISYPLGYHVLKLMVHASDTSWGVANRFAGIEWLDVRRKRIVEGGRC